MSHSVTDRPPTQVLEHRADRARGRRVRGQHTALATLVPILALHVVDARITAVPAWADGMAALTLLCGAVLTLTAGYLEMAARRRLRVADDADRVALSPRRDARPRPAAVRTPPGQG